VNKFKNSKYIIGTFFALAICILIYTSYYRDAKLPVFNPVDFNPELVDISMQGMEENHTVSDFELVNQNGIDITQADYKNKIYVTDFFFTRCPSICPIMSNNMEKLQQLFLEDKEVMFLSISVTPEMDSIPILKKYADEKGAINAKWNITTGKKKHIYNLARKSYFAVVDEGDGGLQDFIHTPNFILVDTEKQIRGIYDGTNDEEIQRLINDINFLLK
jgi:protein SCO1/2